MFQFDVMILFASELNSQKYIYIHIDTCNRSLLDKSCFIVFHSFVGVCV